MAVNADGRIALSANGHLQGGATRFHGRNGRFAKFCNGEIMGRKLKFVAVRNKNIMNNAVRSPVCMSLTADYAGETKLRDLEMEKRDPRTVVAIILGGGAGTRLFPLTKRRAKPAVPIGGAYRLIDVPMSNCINSGINKVYILTQFNSASLNRHLARAYNFGSGITLGDGYVEVLAATQTPGEAGKSWFQGTADAVRQFHWLFEDPRSKDIEDVLILSGDHLYRMDYMDFVQNHRQSGADITLSCLPIDESRASDFGLMKIDNKGKVLSFSEKPKGNDLKAMLMVKLVEMCGTEVSLRCQLPTEDLDALVSITSDEDLTYLIEEYDRTAAAGAVKIRAFLSAPKSTKKVSPPPSVADATSPRSLFYSAAIPPRCPASASGRLIRQASRPPAYPVITTKAAGKIPRHQCAYRNGGLVYLIHNGYNWQ